MSREASRLTFMDRPRLHCILAHHSFGPLQTAGQSVFEHVTPDAAGARQVRSLALKLLSMAATSVASWISRVLAGRLRQA